MIVQSLVKYYEILKKQKKVPLIGWEVGKVSWGINLSPTGELLDLVPLMVQKGKKLALSPKEMDIPQRVVKCSGVLPNLLVENAGYFLGIDKGNKPVRTQQCFDSAKELHIQVLQGVESEEAKRIILFFEQWDIGEAREHPALEPYIKELEAGQNLIFMYNNTHTVVESQEICKAWDIHYRNKQSEEKKYCLVTGELGGVARIHGKIKGVYGAQSAGANLISTNSPSFYSYGLKENMPSAPVGEYAAFAYVTALNYLIGSIDSKQMLGESTLLYWSEDGNEISQKVIGLSLFPKKEQNDDLEGLFKRIAKGLPVDEVDLNSSFYILAIAPNAARLSVSFFYQNTLGNLVINLNKHYQRLEVIRPQYDGEFYMSPQQIIRETINPNSKDKKVSAQLLNGLLQAILGNTRYPQGLYSAVIQRVRSDQDDGKFVKKINWRKAAVLKASLLQTLPNKEKEALTMALNEANTNQAYLLGRLFSVLENIQESANPELNTTIKDRYFNSACATPVIAFPQLIKLSQAHSKKLKRDKPGFAVNFEKQLGSIMNALSSEKPFPPHLNLEEQGLFILGYYQQTQARYIKKEKTENETN